VIPGKIDPSNFGVVTYIFPFSFLKIQNTFIAPPSDKYFDSVSHKI